MLRFNIDRFPLKVLPVDFPVRSWPIAIVTLTQHSVSVVQTFIECAREVATVMACPDFSDHGAPLGQVETGDVAVSGTVHGGGVDARAARRYGSKGLGSERAGREGGGGTGLGQGQRGEK